MTEYALVPITDDTAIVNPDGEMVALRAAPVDTIADFIDYLREQKQAIDAAIRELTAEAVRRADLDNATRLEGSRWIVTVDGDGTSTTYDGLRTYTVLSRLVADGELSAEARDAIVAPTWKVDGMALRRLLKRPAVAAAMVEAVDKVEPKRRAAKLTRA